MSVGLPGYYLPLSLRGEVEEARRHINDALTKSGVGENEVLSRLQSERLKDAYKELGKALQTMKGSSVNYPNTKKKGK
jgi:hypothetical protein